MLITGGSRVLKWAQFVSFFDSAVRSLYLTVFCHEYWRTVGLVCFHQNKKHQAVESPSHVHRCRPVDSNCGIIYVSVERMAVIRNGRRQAECDASQFERECF